MGTSSAYFLPGFVSPTDALSPSQNRHRALHPRTSACVPEVVVPARASLGGFGFSGRGLTNLLPSQPQCYCCSLLGSDSLLYPSPQLPQRRRAREERKGTRKGSCSSAQERQPWKTRRCPAGSRSPQNFPHTCDWVPRGRPVNAQQHDYRRPDPQACCCYSCHPYDHEHDCIRERRCGATSVDAAEHSHYNDGAGPAERQEAESLVQSPSDSSFGVASSCPRSCPDAIDRYRRPERPSISDRRHVHLSSRHPSRCPCVNHQEGPRVRAGSEGKRVRRWTTSQFHCWCLALLELRLPGRYCHWKTEGPSWR